MFPVPVFLNLFCYRNSTRTFLPGHADAGTQGTEELDLKPKAVLQKAAEKRF